MRAASEYRESLSFGTVGVRLSIKRIADLYLACAEDKRDPGSQVAQLIEQWLRKRAKVKEGKKNG